ncbi:MAG: hypothetical protein ACWA41_13100 [Putridiphycobacter sp.]
MKNSNPLEDLKEIRKLMETSTKFLSLSGLSGISAGIIALLGAFYAYNLIDTFSLKMGHYLATNSFDEAYQILELKLIFTAISILTLAVLSALVFTYLSARKKGDNMFSPLAFKLAGSLMLPLTVGGCFAIILYLKGIYILIPAITLLFYGLALLNASKFVHPEIKYLAYFQLVLGLMSSWYLEYSLYFWAFGFGILHIIYGLIMYFKYDRKK